MQSIIALAIGAVGLILFTSLLMSKHINQISYVGLLTVTALVCLVLHGFARLRQLDLKNLKVTLDKIEDVRKDIYTRQEDVAKAVLGLTDLILFESQISPWGGKKELAVVERIWVQKKAMDILARLGQRPKDAPSVPFEKEFTEAAHPPEGKSYEEAMSNLIEAIRRDSEK